MDEKKIKDRVRTAYHRDELNCVTTTLKILAEQNDIDLRRQVIDSAVGMHGAGGYRAQCGLVEGALMFIGILGRAKRIADPLIIELCYRYAEEFEQLFSSLLCRKLRPEGFAPDQPPHLCEGLTCRAVAFSSAFMREHVAGRTER